MVEHHDEDVEVHLNGTPIYQAKGFQLVHEDPHHSFGHDLVGQTWELMF